jgi:hypothetical protein
MGWVHHINVPAEEPDRVQLYVFRSRPLLSTKYEDTRQVYTSTLPLLSTQQSINTATDAITPSRLFMEWTRYVRF